MCLILWIVCRYTVYVYIGTDVKKTGNGYCNRRAGVSVNSDGWQMTKVSDGACTPRISKLMCTYIGHIMRRSFFGGIHRRRYYIPLCCCYFPLLSIYCCLLLCCCFCERILWSFWCQRWQDLQIDTPADGRNLTPADRIRTQIWQLWLLSYNPSSAAAFSS